MLEDIPLIYNTIARFGLIKGAGLLFRIKMRKVERIKVPGIANEISLRDMKSDIGLFNGIMLGDQYHHIPFDPNLKVIIDGGANIGLFSILMKNKFPDARIICIEPDRENFELMTRNLAGYPDIHLEQKGLWSKKTMVSVTDKYNNGKWGMMTEEDELTGSTETISIDGLMQKYGIDRIDVLKLDIECAEKQIFTGDYSYFLSRTKMVVIELHDWIEEGCSKPFFEAINNTFKNYEYGVFGENTVIINKDLSADSSINAAPRPNISSMLPRTQVFHQRFRVIRLHPLHPFGHRLLPHGRSLRRGLARPPKPLPRTGA